MPAQVPSLEQRPVERSTNGLSLLSYLKIVSKSIYLFPAPSCNNAVKYHHSTKELVDLGVATILLLPNDESFF